jgi:hypothetical protein
MLEQKGSRQKPIKLTKDIDSNASIFEVVLEI